MDDILSAHIKQQMDEKRWVHTLGVCESAKSLAVIYKIDADAVEQAALLHDLAKCWSKDKLKKYLLKHEYGSLFLNASPTLWHGPAAAVYSQQELGITDRDTFNAITWHTSGRIGMTLFEKIICLADYIEPNRNFPEVASMREQAKISINQALLIGFESTIRHLLSNKKPIFSLMIDARNDLLKNMEVVT